MRGQYAFRRPLSRTGQTSSSGRGNDAPLVVGSGEKTKFLASDVLAFLAQTDRAIFLDNKEGGRASPRRALRIFKHQGKGGGRKEERGPSSRGNWGKPGQGQPTAHYTLKEIHEQAEHRPRAPSRRTRPKYAAIAERLKGARSVVLTAAGSSLPRRRSS